MLLRFVHVIQRSVRQLVGTRYRPERYYMRGSAPACASRQVGRN